MLRKPLKTRQKMTFAFPTLIVGAALEPSDEQHDLMTRFTAYNIITRYPDKRLQLYKRLDRRHTESELDEIDRMGKWFKSLLE